MGINNPVPQSLGHETRKAAKILTSFVKPNQMIRYEEVIPPHVLQNAKGLCILTVFRAGFLFSGRAGSGVIVARLPDGTWSPPSAVMTAGAGTGGMIGADLTDFIFVLNNKEAVKTFASAGTLTLGGNVSLAAGPLGRAGEASGAAGTSGVATVFSYSKTKGLYAGVSLEGSVLLERKDANQKFYGRPVKAKAILSGKVPAPRACEPLFMVLDSRAFRKDVGFDDMDSEFYNDMPDEGDYDNMSVASSRRGGGGSSRYGGRGSSRYDDYDDYDDDYDSGYGRSSRAPRVAGAGGSGRRSGGGYADDYDYDDDYDRAPRRGAPRGGSRRYDDDYDDYVPRSSRRRDEEAYSDEDNYRDSRYSRSPAAAPPKPKPARSSTTQAEALYSFTGEESGDLSFKKGDIIDITAKSDSVDDWWTGSLDGATGIFPANYVRLI